MEEKIAALISEPTGRIDFDTLALEVFEYQFERNEPYRRFCEYRGQTPATVVDWRRIPAVPTAAFKMSDLCCAAPERVFLTSGTTRGAAARGRHLVPHLNLYRVAALRHFSRCVGAAGFHRPVFSLTPRPSAAPDSSLVQMIQWIVDEFGDDTSDYFVGTTGLEVDRLSAALERVARLGTPVHLLGITAAFERFFAESRRRQRRFHLPYGTIVMDTGGRKRDDPRPLSRRGFLRSCWEVLNVPGYHVINEYGMTELSSQFYDNVLVERMEGRFTPRHKIGPSWTRTLVVDPETLEEVHPGRKGLLRHFDLANCGSVLSVQTEDVGMAIGDGFEIEGRVSGAEPRGCALILESITAANADSLVSSPRNR